MSYIEEFCDSIAILNGGKVALCGDLHEIKRDYPRDRLVVRTENPAAISAAFGDNCTAIGNGALLVRLSSPKDKKAVMTNESVLTAVKETEEKINGKGRVLLRESGPEPVVRVMVECEKEGLCRDYADYIANAIMGSL